MPESDRERLGSGHVRLDPDVVQFVPTRVEAWRGVRAVTLHYADVASLVMNEPKGMSRGNLVAHLHDGQSLSMTFGFSRLPTMRRTYAELWRRIRAARDPDRH